MPQNLKSIAVSEDIITALYKLMNYKELDSFRLVGGTSLSLQFGHRQSIDIDLFTDAEYSTVNFQAIDTFLRNNFKYTDLGNYSEDTPGRMYFIGESAEKAIKLDMFYTDPFIRSPLVVNTIRMAGAEDISAMKLELISGGGRKKDFWDIAELLERYPLSELIGFYMEKYPFFDSNKVISGLTDFSLAEEMDDPLCLKNKVWELIKLDIKEAVMNYLNDI
jgi:hypothetical protein